MSHQVRHRPPTAVAIPWAERQPGGPELVGMVPGAAQPDREPGIGRDQVVSPFEPRERQHTSKAREPREAETCFAVSSPDT